MAFSWRVQRVPGEAATSNCAVLQIVADERECETHNGTQLAGANSALDEVYGSPAERGRGLLLEGGGPATPGMITNQALNRYPRIAGKKKKVVSRRKTAPAFPMVPSRRGNAKLPRALDEFLAAGNPPFAQIL